MSNLSHFQKITPEKALEQFQHLTSIDMFARMAAMACVSLDMKFKKPLIAQRISRIKQDCAFIQADLKRDRKYGFSVIDEDYVEDATSELFGLVGLALHFGKEGIAALNENLKQQLDEARKNQSGASKVEIDH